MPHMTNERVRAGLAHEEDLFSLHEVNMKTHGLSHLEMCIQCGPRDMARIRSWFSLL
jgi:hypothetical protein